MATGHFDLKKAKNGQFHFTLKAGNGEVILGSEMYASKASAENGITSVQNNATDEGQYEMKAGKDGQHYFVLKAKNHQVIGVSEMYTTASSAQKGMQSVVKNGSSKDIRDLTHADALSKI
ncbi:YegP family protein [Rouxiella chamberiensis]|uniref:YegP family protein n=1 Tax=Rouxiella chamberiensis TaxID=1513468 RepID=A0ABY7HU28_9GAMM|nr:YegP family protein [Rouxiella chamberiensis]WAT02943.1 YegP family protein [Rouxiella chamberiensis]